MNRFICIVGISGSGKSTYASKLAAETGYPIVSSDALRKELTGSESDFSKDDEIWSRYIKARLYKALAAGSVIFDATGLTKRGRKRIYELAMEGGAEIHCHYFEPNLIRAKLQNSLRARKVPEAVIEEMAKAWQTPTKEEGFDVVVNIDESAR